MKRFIAVAALLLVPAVAVGADAVAPPWAYYGEAPPAQRPPPRPDDGTKFRVPGSDKEFTATEIGNWFGTKDWFPEEHPNMPDVVRNGRPPNVQACAICHLPNGAGHPESASITGLPAEYLFQQMKDFQSDKRKNIVPELSHVMVTITKAMTDEEMKAAAAYYASLKPRQFVKVVEGDVVPVTVPGPANMKFVRPGGATEALGQRIIQVPEDPRRALVLDPHSGFTAYVPAGSVKKGEELASTGGGGKTITCAVCHGPGLKGAGNVPGIAGRHPTYMVRQMLDIQKGSRNGAGAALMKGVVEKLTMDDMVNLAAYTASLTP